MTTFVRNQWYVAACGREVTRDLLARTILGEPGRRPVRIARHRRGPGPARARAGREPGEGAGLTAAPLHRFTEKTITDPQRLRRELAGVRRSGYAASDRQVTMDALSVAAPVYGPDGSVTAAVSLVVRSAAAQPEALAPLVRTAVRGISRTFGAVTG